MKRTKIATRWHAFAAPFDPKNPQYRCHIHGHDARTRNVMTAALGLLILSFLLQWIGWFMPGEVLLWIALASLLVGVFGIATDGACFPTCTCQSGQEVPRG